MGEDASHRVTTFVRLAKYGKDWKSTEDLAGRAVRLNGKPHRDGYPLHDGSARG